MSSKIVTALSGTQFSGTGWIDASSLAGDKIRRVELAAAALGTTLCEVWASSDNTAAANYTGTAPAGQRPPTPPGGRFLGTINGPAGTMLIFPEPAQAPGTQSPAAAQVNQGAEAFYYNVIRVSADTTAVNVILVGEIAASAGGGSPWLLGGNTPGATMIGGTVDNNDLRLLTNATRRFTILKTGQVAVGPADPGASNAFEVQDGSASTVVAVRLTGAILLNLERDRAGDTGVWLTNTDAGAGSGPSFNWANASQVWTARIYSAAAAIPNAWVLHDSTATLDRLVVDTSGRVAVGAATPDPTTLLDVQSTTLGFGLPGPLRVTLNALVNPKIGLVVFDTTNKIITGNVGTAGTPIFARLAGGPSVNATNANAQSVTDGAGAATVTTWVAGTNVGANFVAATGVFTAPVPGFYPISVQVEFAAIAAIVGAEFTAGIFKNGTVVKQNVVECQVAAANVKRCPSVVMAGLQLAAGDTVDFRVSQNSGSGPNALTAVTSRNTLEIGITN